MGSRCGEQVAGGAPAAHGQAAAREAERLRRLPAQFERLHRHPRHLVRRQLRRGVAGAEGARALVGAAELAERLEQHAQRTHAGQARGGLVGQRGQRAVCRRLGICRAAYHAVYRRLGVCRAAYRAVCRRLGVCRAVCLRLGEAAELGCRSGRGLRMHPTWA